MVTTRYSDQFFLNRDPNRDKKLCGSTSDGTDQYQNGSSNLLTPFESNLDRLGMLSPTHDQRSQQKTGKITLQPVLINKSKFLKATHFVQK